MNLIPRAKNLQHERASLAAAVARREHGRVTDPIITPFVRALVSEGFQIKTVRGGCDALGRCPVCQGGYLYTAIKDDSELKLCPHCRDAQDRKAG